MKKLIIQIPCLNEEQTLPAVLSALPRQVPGIDRVEWLVVNDGSTDRTTVVARAGGADHVLELTHVGLARAFMAGLDESLRLGADIIVNLDGDNQYSAADIPKLVAPLLEGRADIAVGARPIDHIRHFSASKKFFQKVGSWVVRKVSGTSIVDCTSGFRAISRRAALELHVLNSYTYTLETIIQAGQKNIPAVSVPIRTNPYTRPSRLMKSTAGYIGRSIAVIFSIGMTYQPLRFFLRLGALPLAAGFFLAVRWLVIHFSGSPKTHVPSLVVAAILTLSGFQIWVFGLIAELVSANRKILEDIRLGVRRAEFKK